MLKVGMPCSRGVIRDIDIARVRPCLRDLAEDGEAAEPGIEDENGRCHGGRWYEKNWATLRPHHQVVNSPGAIAKRKAAAETGTGPGFALNHWRKPLACSAPARAPIMSRAESTSSAIPQCSTV